jgi:hypothetical protein
VPPLTMSIVDPVIFRNDLKWIPSTFLWNYRANYTVNLTTTDPNKKWFKSMAFTYTPSPVILSDPITNTNIGIKLWSKRTFYANWWITVNLDKDDYSVNLYSINASFKNVKIFFNWQRMNLWWLINLNSTWNVKVSYDENKLETNFMPALWIKWMIK